MPRYIDADKLKELIDGGFDIDFDEVLETKKALLNMIDYQETADVVEVIRCKECEYWKQEQSGKPWKCKRYYCTRSVNIKTEESDFCSFAKRRNNEEECISRDR